MPVFITYQRGSRHLFATTKRVLSPPGVEGASLPTSTTQVQDKGKRPMHDEGPSGEQGANFILIHDDDADEESAKLRRTIQEQKTEIQDLSLNLERAKWIIRYLEQRNKQLEDQHEIMELQSIRENRQAAQYRRIELTPLEQEINNDHESWLERINIHLEGLLEKVDKDKTILRQMVYHYRAQNMSSKARIRSLKAKLSKATKRQKRQKEQDRL